MVVLNNNPPAQTYLRLQARKSFSLGLYITDHHGRPLDIAGTTIRMVARKTNFPTSVEDDSANLIINSTAELVMPLGGVARFDLQAADLDHKPGEYEYSVTLMDEGYSSVLFKGILELDQNTEYNSVDETYTAGQMDSALQVKLRGAHTLQVRTGPTLAPGTTSFTDGDKSKLDGIEAGAEVNVLSDWNAPDNSPQQILNKPIHRLLPIGGARSSILVKRSKAEGDTMWVTQSDDGDEGLFPSLLLFPSTTLFPSAGGGSGRGGLDATGIEAGLSPISNGFDSWEWRPIESSVSSINGLQGEVELTADDIPDGEEKVMMTLAERLRVAVDLLWNNIGGKPDFGTAALKSEADFLPATGIAGGKIISGTVAKERLPKLGGLLGQSDGTAPPSGGADGDFYFQYEV